MQSHRIHRRTGRLATAALTAAALAAFPAAADAALSVQPNDPALGFPASVTDTVSGLALGSCQDTSGFCIETPAPNQAAPLAVPGNYTPDGEAFYFLADATVPNAGIGLARFALEQAFTGPDPVAGEQILFGRVRFRFTDLTPGATYRVTHPYGVDEFVADGTGRINVTDDQGCVGPPCDFAASSYGQITSFLQWDPSVAPAPPAGYIGNVAQAHKVIGSPTGTNSVRLERLDGGVPTLIGQTDQFLVQGKLAGAAPTPAPFIVADAATLDFASRQSGTVTPAKTLTVANHGTAPLNVTSATIGGADAGDFKVAANSCTTPVAPGASCAIGVTFGPLASGNRSGTLTIASNSLGAPHTVALKGVGTPASTPAPPPVVVQAPAPAPVVIQAAAPQPTGLLPAIVATSRQLTASRLRVSRTIRLKAARSRGLTVGFTAPAGATVARLRLVKGSGKVVATKVVDIFEAGPQTVHLRVRGARAGRYRLEVAVGRNASTLARALTSTVTLVR